MSNDQLDDGFRNRVKEVFENYEDDSADEGWLLLREKYPAKERPDRAIFWWRFAGVAACLALLFYFYPAGRNKIIPRLKHPFVGAAQQTVARQPVASHEKAGGNAYIHKKVQQRQRYALSKAPSAHPKTNLQVGMPNTPHAAAIIAGSQPVLTKDSSLNAYNSPATASNNKTADTSHKKPDAAVSGSILALFEKDAQNGNNKIVQKQAKNVIFGVYAASYVNYAKGSRAQFNNGGGLSADIRISDRLSISTGLFVAQNSLAYSGGTSSLAAAALAPATYSRNFPQSNNLEPSSTNQAVNLVNLDVPVNLTYQFNPQKRNIYLSAGLSSGTFINESYVTTYNYSIPQNNTEQLSQDEQHKSFDDFYLGQMFNLAFGLGYPLGKNSLVIEPFFKYPLGGLGDQHILFGSGGLNLKFNFGQAKLQK